MEFILATGRSSFFFTDLEHLYSNWDETELAHEVASMPCLVAFLRAGSLAKGMNFVDRINGLKGNPVKNRKKYLILKTPAIDQSLLHNKTIPFNVHIINDSKTGKVYFSIPVFEC